MPVLFRSIVKRHFLLLTFIGDEMKISGIQKLTLLDFPSYLACTIFTQACNFSCPFCHNSGMIDANKASTIDESYIFEFLSRRKEILQAVCISGGEPFVQDDIFEFIKKIKAMGFLVKVDTNGSFPQKIKYALENNLIDYIAMDVKNSSDKYQLFSSSDISFDNIQESIELIRNSDIQYEFRTTVAKGLHNENDIHEIGKLCSQCKHFYIQNFRDSQNVLDHSLESFSQDELYVFRDILKKYIQNVEIR